MKTTLTLLTALCFVGCAHIEPVHPLVKNLDSWQRIDGYTLTHDVLIDAEGIPVLGVPTNQVTSKWQIHPCAPLMRVAKSTQEFTGDQRIELWTSSGIYIVGAPNYGGRRLPWFGKTDLEYHVTPDIKVLRDHDLVRNGSTYQDALDFILADIGSHTNLQFVNLYFEFQPTLRWMEAEPVIAKVLGGLDGMRGLWIGDMAHWIRPETNDPYITVHFHDVWKKEWK